MTSHPSVVCGPHTLSWLIGGLALNQPSEVLPTAQQRLGFAKHPRPQGLPGGSVLRSPPARAGASGDVGLIPESWLGPMP